MKLRLLGTILTCATVTFLYGPSASYGAIISWGAATTISGVTDVLNSSSGYQTDVFAYNLGTTVNSTVNGVTFTGLEFGDVSSLDLSFTAYADGPFGSLNNPYNGLAPEYKALLQSAQFGGTPATVTLKNLTIGMGYAVQLWINDSRSVTRADTIDGSITLDFNTTDVDGGLGQFSVGAFTADATTQTIIINPLPSSETQLNAIQLRSVVVPEPSNAVLIVGLGLGGFILWRRRRLFV